MKRKLTDGLYSRGNGSQLATLGYITQTQEKALDLNFELQDGYSLGVWKTSNPLSIPTEQNNNNKLDCHRDVQNMRDVQIFLAINKTGNVPYE